MPCPTGSFKIISRGKGQSCMASCAYYSGEKKDYHDKGDGNLHVHIMLTLCAMDENGKWLFKSKNVYTIDENGNCIRYWMRKIIPDALPRILDGHISVEDAIETVANRKKMEQTEEGAVQAAL